MGQSGRLSHCLWPSAATRCWCSNAGRRLDLVLRGQAADCLLDTYGAERRPQARALVEFAVELGRIICVRDPAAASARDAQMRSASGRGEQKVPEPVLGASPLLRTDDVAAGRLGFLQSIRGRTVAIGRDVQDVDGSYRRWLDALQADAVLVRPDFNVFGAGNAPALVESLMAAWETYAKRRGACAWMTPRIR